MGFLPTAPPKIQALGTACRFECRNIIQIKRLVVFETKEAPTWDSAVSCLVAPSMSTWLSSDEAAMDAFPWEYKLVSHFHTEPYNAAA